MDMSIEVNGLKWSVDDDLAIHMQAYAVVTGLTVAQVFERMARDYLSRRGPNVQALLRAAVAAYADEQVFLTAETKWAVFMWNPGGHRIQHQPTVDMDSAIAEFTKHLSPVGHEEDWRRWPAVYVGSYSVDRLSPLGLFFTSWRRLVIENDQWVASEEEGEQLIEVDPFTPVG